MRKIYLSIMKLMIITVIVSLSILIFPLLAQDQKPYVSETGLFENPYCDEDRKPGLTDMLRWKFSYHILQKPFISDNYEYTIMPPEFINLPSSIYSGVITWVGHSTFIIQVDGINIITDPVWSERVGFFSGRIGHQRYAPPGVPWEKLPPVDVVVISHSHYDHLDPEEAVRAFQDLGARFLAAMHWGTFDQAEENLGDPPRELQYQVRNRGLRNEIIWIFAFGESRAIPPRDKEAIQFYSQELFK